MKKGYLVYGADMRGHFAGGKVFMNAEKANEHKKHLESKIATIIGEEGYFFDDIDICEVEIDGSAFQTDTAVPSDNELTLLLPFKHTNDDPFADTFSIFVLNENKTIQVTSTDEEAYYLVTEGLRNINNITELTLEKDVPYFVDIMANYDFLSNTDIDRLNNATTWEELMEANNEACGFLYVTIR